MLSWSRTQPGWQRDRMADLTWEAVIDAVVGCPPEALAGALIGPLAPLGVVDCVVMVVDYAQDTLIDLTSDQRRIPVEATAPGAAFCTQLPVVEPDGDTAWLWVPVTDLGTRLGIMGLKMPDASRDEQEIAWRIAGLLAQAIVCGQRRTDLLTVRRRQQRMTLGADLQWQVLPPTTFVRPEFAIGGVVEPAYENGGDAFDYGYTAGRLSFAVLDAMGHGVHASIMASVTLASIRHSRSIGLELNEIRTEADRAVEREFGDLHYVTALLGSFDPISRRLHWLTAGHPPPLLVRDGEIRELVCAPCLPLGLGGNTKEVTSLVLNPGDALLMYTDGVTETPDRPTPAQAQARLEEVIAAHYDPQGLLSESLRRLAYAVLDQNNGELGDDATMLMLAIPATRP